jgi:peroxiredoxin family protein
MAKVETKGEIYIIEENCFGCGYCAKYCVRDGIVMTGDKFSAKGFPLPTFLGALPGMSAFATHMMKKEMEKIDIPPVGEFIEMISDAGGHLYACKATVDMFHLTAEDFVPQMERVLTVGDFYELAAGGEIIFT